MSRPFSPNEPARQPEYRKAYKKIKRSLEELGDGIDYLYKTVNDLRERVRVVENQLKIKKDGEGDPW